MVSVARNKSTNLGLSTLVSWDLAIDICVKQMVLITTEL